MSNTENTLDSVIKVEELQVKYKGFCLNVPNLRVPKGFATALIGENGAGKTTLLNVMAGIKLKYKGFVTYFEKYKDGDRDKEEYGVRENIGYAGGDGYFLPHWNAKRISEISEVLFENFDSKKFEQLCNELALDGEGSKKSIKKLSDGNRMKLMLAAVWARQTKCLILDEPASPLDPLMRDKLCAMIRDYLYEQEGEKSVIFSTHNISDMENVTDYAVFIEQGEVVEQGFVEDLKEKYILVKGDTKDVEGARGVLFSIDENKMGFEGICLAERLNELAGLNLSYETPTLFQISVAIMKKYSKIKV